MNEVMTGKFWQELYQSAYHWLQINILTSGTLTQLVLIAIALVMASMIAPRIKKPG